MARRPSSKYVIVEASEDESNFSSENLDEETEVAETTGTQRSWARFTQELEQRYAGVDEDEEAEYEEKEETMEQGIKQSSLVPKNTSPRLFIVRVKRGSEREITMRIVHNEPKSIFSIVCKDGLKGYLYVEAFQKQHVVDALESLKGVSKTKISVVPQKEMIEALTYQEQEAHGEWGRIKKGKYKNDLVKILTAEGEMVRIMVVPRINGERQLFKPEDFRDENVIRSKECYIYKRDTYVDGFLEKDVLKSSIDFDIEPTFAELEEFKQSCPVSVGERVRVTKGELIGMKGSITSIRGSTATIKDGEEKFEVQSSALVKHFDVGEVVSFKGENGIVVGVEGKDYIVAIRDFTEELKANVEDLKAPVPENAREERAAEARQQRARKDPLINKEVRIQQGDYKGYNGVVKEVYKNVCRVQLNSNMKFVSVEKDSLSALGYVSVEGYSEGAGYRTPGYKTPGYKTPGYKTPGYKTPGYKTPGYRTPGIETTEETGAEWLTEEDKPFKGVLVKVSGEELVLEDYKNNLFITKNGSFTTREISFVQPQKNDFVCVLDGEKKGVSGILIAINGDFGIIRSNSGPVIHLPMSQISRRAY